MRATHNTASQEELTTRRMGILRPTTAVFDAVQNVVLAAHARSEAQFKQAAEQADRVGWTRGRCCSQRLQLHLTEVHPGGQAATLDRQWVEALDNEVVRRHSGSIKQWPGLTVALVRAVRGDDTILTGKPSNGPGAYRAVLVETLPETGDNREEGSFDERWGHRPLDGVDIFNEWVPQLQTR